MRELSDDEVFGAPIQELSDADVFGPPPAKGPGFSDQLANGVAALFGSVITPLNAGAKVRQLVNTVNPPEPTGSVFDRLPPEPEAFSFREASMARRAMEDQAAREAEFGSIGPIVGPKPTVGSVASGLLSDLTAGGKATRAGINQMAGDISGSQYLLDKAEREVAQADLMRAVNTPNFETETAQGIYGGVSSTVRQLPAIAAAIATRNPNIALGGMVAPMVPEEYGKFRQRGADPLVALAGAAGSAGTEYITEKLPMSFLVRQFGRAGAGQFLTGMLAREVPGEQLATLVQDAIDTAIANPDKTWGDYVAERPGAAYQTLLATLTQTGIMGGANAIATRLSGQQQAPEAPTPALGDYQNAASLVFGRNTPPAPSQAPAPEPAPAITPEVLQRILGAIEQTQPVEPAVQPSAPQSAELSDAEVFGAPTNMPAQPTATMGTQTMAQAGPGFTAADVMRQTANVQNPQAAQAGQATEAPSLQAPAPAGADAAAPAGVPAAPASPDVEAAGVEATQLPATPQIPQPAQQQQAQAPQRLGVDNVPLTDGGKPFKSQAAAAKAKKLQPMMRVVKVEGGFALADKTPAQIAAQAKAAKRLGGVGSGPMSAHAFIAANGGLSRETAADLGIEGNVRVGGRWLYARNGGMTIEQATEKLLESGYINTDSHNDAYDIIRQSVQSPQYTPEGWEEVAQAEREAQFEDYLEAQQEAEQDDPFGPAYEYTADELAADPFFGPAPAALKAEVQALMAQAENAGIDVESLLERVAQQTQDQPEQEYYERAREALTQTNDGTADQGRDGNADAAQPERGQEAQPASGEAGGPVDGQEGADQGLTSYTPDEITQRLDRLEQAEQERQAQDRQAEQQEARDRERREIQRRSEAAADTFELGQDPMANLSGQNDIFSSPVGPEDTQDSGPEIPINESRPAQREESRQGVRTIDDFGEKLGGAKKDRAPSLSRELTDEDIATKPFSQIWPAAEIDGIEDKFAAAVAFAARAEVPAKPRVSYKVKSWVEKVKVVRGLAQWITSGKYTPVEFMDKLRELRGLKAFGDKVELLAAIDREQWGRIGAVEAFPDAYRIGDGGERIPGAFTRVEIDGKTNNIPVGNVIAAIDRVDELLAGEAEAKKMQFEIRQNSKTGEVFINKKGDKEYRKLKTFADVKAARAYIKDNYDDLVAEWDSVKQRNNVKKSDVRSDVNRPRTGADRRNGQDVTPEQFGTTFGFRGVEFGNWVGQGANAKERQGMLNQAYDALLDLAEIVNIPPRAISLDGTMGLAFGSRGSGKAAAHFEPSNLVINLTKTKGAGSLAHEWFHALDNYFARQRGGEVPMQRGVNPQLAYRTNNYITYRPEPLYIHKTKTSTPITKARLQRYREQNPKSDYYSPDNWQVDPRHPNGVRPEVERAFADLVEALEQSPMSGRASSLDQTPGGYWSRIIERAARSFENYVITKMMEQGYQNDYLANVRPVEDFPRERGRYPYLLPEEVAPIAEAFDTLFGTIKTKETDRGVMLFEPDAPYNAEAPRRNYTDDRQLQLFLDNGPDPSQAGPRGEAAQREAVAAVDDLRSTENILGLALSRDYSARQRVSLVGQKVSSAEDLAVLAQVYRDPRFETFRVVFTNDSGKVVSQVGLTSRLPASAPAVMGNDTDGYLKDLADTARNRGATGYYLLHNHPSGFATPSRADINLTREFERKLPMLRLQSHVVIDTNQYSTIDGAGRVETLERDFGQPAPYRAQEWADMQIGGPADVMAMAKRLQVDSGAITLIHTDNQYRVKAISTIPNDASTMSKDELKKLVLKASLQTQGAQVFAVGRDSKALARIGTMVVDAIYVEDSGEAKSLRGMGVIAGGAPLPSSRRARVSPDTSPEFNYLRERSAPQQGRRVAEPSRDQTQTPEFKRWFGDWEDRNAFSSKRDKSKAPVSMAVGQGQRPLVLYHATNSNFDTFEVARPTINSTNFGDFETERQGIFTTPDIKFAEEYFRGRDGANVMPVYMNVKAPVDLTEGISGDVITDIVENSDLRRNDFYNLPTSEMWSLFDGDFGRQVVGALKKAGYDGAIIKELDRSREREVDVWVAFDANQIKSATGNNGQFDPENPSIVREDGAEYNAPRTNPNRDALGRVKFRLGEVALHKLDAVTRPLQERFGMRMASPELRKQLRQMKATIDAANRAAVNVAKEMNAMTEADRAMVSDIVEKMLAPGVIPPEHAVRVADAITKTMDRQTDELVELGMLSKDSADRWRGRYLPRIYNRETELADDPLLKRLFKSGTPTMQGIGGGSLKGRGLFQDVSVDTVSQWLEMGYEVRDPHWSMNQGKLELRDPNAPRAAREQVTVWRDWTPSERAQMGESRDALLRFVQGYTSMQRDIALGRLFNNIANNPEWVRRSGSEGWVQVPTTEIPDTGGVKRYGTLAGLFVRRDVMSHLNRFEEGANDALQIYREALGIWKEGKTALNPVAHFNNVASNISMAHFAGVSYWDGHKYVNAVRDLVNNAPMVDEARDVGLFTGSFTKEEMVQSMPPELQKLMQQEEGVTRKAGRQVMNALTFWLRQPLRDAYEFEDTFFKYLIYRDARQQGMEPAEAMDYALRYIFTYDDLPSGARKVRDFAIPFFSWTYKALPALLHTALVYPWRLAAPAAMLHGINLAAYALAAGDEDDDWIEKIAKGRELEKEERAVLPEYREGMSALGNPKSIRLGTDELTGNPVFLDVSRVVPGGDMFDMVNQAGGLPLPAPLMPNHPVLSAFSAMIANKEMFFGRDIVDRNDTGLEAAEKRAKWMAGFILPAVAPGGYHSQRIADAAANAMETTITVPGLGEFTGVDRSGSPVQPKYAAMATVGIKARPVDLELEEQRQRANEAFLIRSIAAEVRSMARLYQRGAVSEQMMEKTRDQAREKIERIREED